MWAGKEEEVGRAGEGGERRIGAEEVKLGLISSHITLPVALLVSP